MELTEKEIEDFVYNDLLDGGFRLQERGFELSWFIGRNKANWYRQLNIDPYGICDIVGFYRDSGYIVCELIELKRTKIDCNHLEQIARYKQGLKIYLQNTLRLGSPFHIKMTLIGCGYDGLYLQNSLPINIYDLKYDVTGFDFDGTDGYSTWTITSAKNKSFRNGKKI